MLAAPGKPDFDSWCLTDPRTRTQWQQDPAARGAMDRLWTSDPDPPRTLGIQTAIEAAMGSGAIEYATSGAGEALGHYYMAPWPAIYVAQCPLTPGGQPLQPGQQVTFEVCDAELLVATPFTRRILVSDFRRTDKVLYYHPADTRGHHRQQRHSGC